MPSFPPLPYGIGNFTVLRRYPGDETLHPRRPGGRVRGLALVYHGRELACAAAVEAGQ